MNWENVQEEFSDYIENGFEPFLTEDGSVTLKPSESVKGDKTELMHSRRGAYSESEFIYSQGCSFYLKKNPHLANYSVISVGLGLGYNELLIVYNCMETCLQSFRIVSYEKETFLVDAFTKRVKSPSKYPIFWKPFIRNIGSRDKLLKLQKNILDKIKHCGELSSANISPFKGCVLICFDAYSSKTSENLWNQSFLTKLLANTTSGSVFCTYAATGSLNRALKSNDYKNINKHGFKGKRQSTCALRI